MINSSGKVTTAYCSSLVYTWLLNWGDNHRHWCHLYSNPEKLKTITSQQYIKIIKGKSTGISFGKHPKYQGFALHPRSRKNIKVNNYLNYPVSAYQFRPRRSEKVKRGYWSKLKKVVEAFFRLSCGEVDDSVPPSTHVINSSGKVTTTYCSRLVYICLLYTSPSPRDS